MDIDSGLRLIIDEYISDALDATGTRRPPRAARVHEPWLEPEPADLEPQTEPLGSPYDEYEVGQACVIDEQNADAALLAQVAQQLAHSESALEPLPRARAPRSTIDLDEDEITNIVARPDADKPRG